MLLALVLAGVAPAAARVEHRARSAAPLGAAADARRQYTGLLHDLGAVNGLFREDDGSYAKAWPFSQALAAAISIAHLPNSHGERVEVRRLIALLPSYFDGQAYEPYATTQAGDDNTKFFDDNEWLALDLVEASTLLRSRAVLAEAQREFTWISTGWDTETDDTCSGGVFWANDPSIPDRNTVSTANGAVLALELYLKTRDASYLRWGRRMYAWVHSCLSDPDGLYADHIDGSGHVEATEWAYNQGAMVAAGALLYTATGQRAYLDDAATLADAALGHYAADDYAGQPAVFVAIFYRYLAVLDKVRNDPMVEPALSHYVASLERAAPSSGSQVLDRAAAVQLAAELARASSS